eukprot:TRINITY_DN6949_c0_g2_i1.p1 TRINITY_DN6949_c0_g2~~TRINITY_DN6949_c0_g2_i1.p1  ORF type:complete len:113 (+),score=27.13 TRINITY_DN6949_c0_g2_i1:48-341(+)
MSDSILKHEAADGDEDNQNENGEDTPEEDDDPIDPKDVLTEKCSETLKCQSLKSVMDECTERVESHPGTQEKCSQELFDFMGCVDLCVSKQLFKYLK